MHTEFHQALLNPHRSISGIESNHISDEQRFSVYRNNVYSALIAALSQSFPTVYQLVGESYFKKVAREYVSSNLPTSAVLIEYGEHFPKFIGGLYEYHKLAYLEDVARLDWIYVQSANERDESSIALESLAPYVEQPDELAKLKFEWVAPVQLISSKFPIFSIWQAHQSANPEIALKGLDLSQSEIVLLTRPAYQVRLHRLPTTEGVFVTRLFGGESIEKALQDTEEINLVEVLRLLIVENCIKSLEVN